MGARGQSLGCNGSVAAAARCAGQRLPELPHKLVIGLCGLEHAFITRICGVTQELVPGHQLDARRFYFAAHGRFFKTMQRL